MYGEEDKIGKAREHKHMTFCEAGKLARKAGAKQLWLTHFSPSLNRPEDFMEGIRKIFPEAQPGRDGKSLELKFED